MEDAAVVTGVWVAAIGEGDDDAGGDGDGAAATADEVGAASGSS